MRFVFLFSVLLLVFVKNGSAAPSRIVGGTDAIVDNYPFITNVQYLFMSVIWSHTCGGSLITTSHILSAAHCFDHRPSQYRFRLGSSSATYGGISHTSATIIEHPLYDNLDYDFAIVKLDNPASLSPTIGVINYARGDYIPRDGDEVIAVGWGRLSWRGPVPDQLQEVSIEVLNQDICHERYASLKADVPGYDVIPDVTDRMMCAGIQDVGGYSACQGDSGGPLVHAGSVVVGVMSWTYECAHDYYPLVTARVSSVAEWIETNIVN